MKKAIAPSQPTASLSRESKRSSIHLSIAMIFVLALGLNFPSFSWSWSGEVSGVSNPGKVASVSQGSINKIAGVSSSAPTLATCKQLYAAGYTSSGNYTIDTDGAGGDAPFTAYCDQTTSGGGWTMLLGSSNPTDLCSRFFSASGTYSGYSCSASTIQLDVLDGTNDPYTPYSAFVNLSTDFSFQEMRFTGTVYSSGGTGQNIWDMPDNANRNSSSTLRGCANGAQSGTLDFGAGGTTASWYVWSDYGNVCGSTGGYWIVNQVYVREPETWQIYTTCKDAYDQGETSSGEYLLDPDGVGTGEDSFVAYCDQTNNGGGWTMLVGSTNPTDLCSRYLSASGTYTNYSCSETNVRIDVGEGVQSPYADSAGTLTISTDFNFRYIRFTGSVFSSGGTANGVWDYPDNASRTGGFVLQGCTSGLYSNTNDFGSNGTTAAWYVWSDYGDFCGSEGGYWDISTIYVKEQ